MTKDALDKYLAHLPSRRGPSSNLNKRTTAPPVRPLPGLKGPRGLSSKAVMMDSITPMPPVNVDHNLDESLADVTKKLDLDDTKSDTDNDDYDYNNRTFRAKEPLCSEHTPPTVKEEPPSPEDRPPIPTFSFGATNDMPIPTFSFGTNDDTQEEEAPLLNLAVGLQCGGCDKMISGMAITAAGHRWHADCFKCQHCHQDLEHVAFYEKDGLPYCALDYHELFTTRCQYCHTPIEEKSIHALGKYYHVGHFFCRECGKPFDEDSTFMEHDGHPYCEKDYLAKFAHKCKGCKEDITSSFLEALGGKWHTSCFVCVDCGRAFESNTFYVRNDLPYCELHSRRIKKPA